MAGRAPIALQTPIKINLPSYEERVRARAYEIYLQRGQRDGSAEEDWRQAEAEIRQEDSQERRQAKD